MESKSLFVSVLKLRASATNVLLSICTDSGMTFEVPILSLKISVKGTLSLKRQTTHLQAYFLYHLQIVRIGSSL